MQTESERLHWASRHWVRVVLVMWLIAAAYMLYQRWTEDSQMTASATGTNMRAAYLETTATVSSKAAMTVVMIW